MQGQEATEVVPCLLHALFGDPAGRPLPQKLTESNQICTKDLRTVDGPHVRFVHLTTHNKQEVGDPLERENPSCCQTVDTNKFVMTNTFL